MTSQTGKQTIAIYIAQHLKKQGRLILYDVLARSKGNQTMKFGQLINVTQKHFLLENDTHNVIEKLFPDPFQKVKIEYISG